MDVPQEALVSRLRDIQKGGFPNYFGPQRFGHKNSNFEHGRALLANPRFKHSRDDKEKIFLSSVRSWLFNHLLSRRIEEGNWCAALKDDLLILDGTNSFFRAEGHEDELERRLREADIHLSGPLWGTPMRGYSESLEARERDWLSPFRGECVRLEQLDVKMTRRALRAMAKNLVWAWQDKSTLSMEFELESGVFATSLLRELVSVIDRGGNPHKDNPSGLAIREFGQLGD